MVVYIVLLLAVNTVLVQNGTMTDDTQMKIRLSAELKALIDAATKESKRSLNGEIVARLEASFQAPNAIGADDRVDWLVRDVETLRAQIRGLEMRMPK